MSDALCIPRRDSPGNLHYTQLNMSKPSVAADYLHAILDDGCLQVWSAPYARYFWYGVGVVIALFVAKRLLRMLDLRLRLEAAAAAPVTSTSSIQPARNFPVKLLRSLSYFQRTPIKIPLLVKIPSAGNVLMILAYLGFLMGLNFVNVSTGDDQTLISMGVRAGWLSVAQLPLIVLLANKRNFIEILTAVSYERLNVFHRWVARGLLLTTSLHFGLQSSAWARAGVMQLEWRTDTCPPTGIAAYALVLWMNLSTLPPFRNMAYELFVAQHIITFMGLIIAIMFHLPSTAYYTRTYIYIASGLYLSSRFIQTVLFLYRNNKPTRALVKVISPEITQISLKSAQLKSWRPGAFVLLSIPRYGILQSHPATIASTPVSDDGKLTFFLRKHRGFTKKIACAAEETPRLALIDGPYGGRQSDLAAFQTAVLIAGSTGISFTLPILTDLAERASRTQLPIKRILFVWALKYDAFAVSLSQSIASAVSRLRAAGIQVDLRVQLTSRITWPSNSSYNPTSEKLDIVKVSLNSTEAESPISSTVEAERLATSSGRPDLDDILAQAQLGMKEEIGVAVCGPLSMSTAVRNKVASMQSQGQGVYLHVEGFSW